MLVGVVLAGGSGRRLGGADKPGIEVGGRVLLERALDALAGAQAHTEPGPTVVVGPPRPTGHAVRWTTETPPGAGPVAALAAGLAALDAGQPTGQPTAMLPAGTEVALLAADLVGITAATLTRLRAALAAGRADGVVLCDANGRRQWLIGVWRLGPLRAALPVEPAGRSLHSVLGGLAVAELPEQPGESADIDTPDDLARARALPLRDGRGRPPGGPSQPSHW